jgi:hypothetical protein
LALAFAVVTAFVLALTFAIVGAFALAFAVIATFGLALAFPGLGFVWGGGGRWRLCVCCGASCDRVTMVGWEVISIVGGGNRPAHWLSEIMESAEWGYLIGNAE